MLTYHEVRLFELKKFNKEQGSVAVCDGDSLIVTLYEAEDQP